MSARRVAALYDIHGNLPALEAVLAEIAAWGADEIVVGGDVTLGPMPRECLARLRALHPEPRFLSGNCDRLVVAAGADRLDAEPDAARLPAAAREALTWTARELDPSEREFCASWPASVTLDVVGFGPVRFCHATARNDTELFTEATAESRVASMFAGLDECVVVCGHTHMQFNRVVGGVRVMNAGSVGMPFGPPGAYWLRLGRDARFDCTHYDLRAAAARVRATKYPGAVEFAAKNVLEPPTAEAMRAAFERGTTAGTQDPR